MNPSLTPFFHPKGVVIAGASSQPEKLGYAVARNLVQSGYRGAIHFVNPKGGTLFGWEMYASLADVPEPLELAVLVVPAPAAPESLRLCGERGIKAVILLSGGFRETGSEGAALENECLEVCQQYGMRLVGPNCVGLIDTNLPLDTTFLQTATPPPGDVGFISHSGAICAALVDWSRQQGFSFSRIASLGNQADVNETDLLGQLADDPDTRVIAMYLEHIGSGVRFVQEASRTVHKKPIIALKAGRSSAGQKAAASHTGALAGSESAYDAAFEKAGVLRARNTEEMFDWARALAWCPLPQGRRVAILTNAGGPGVLAADAVEAEGLALAEFTPGTIAALSSLLPTAASKHNPVDMIASGGPKEYAACLNVLLKDPNVDSVLVLSVPPPMFPAEQVVEAIQPTIHSSSKPVLAAFTGGMLTHTALEHFQQGHMAAYSFPERAASALACLTKRAEYLAKPDKSPTVLADVEQKTAKRVLAETPAGSWLESEACFHLLEAYRIPGAPIKLTHSPEEAAQCAAQWACPVVLKVASPDLPHKSDVGGVLLDLQNLEDVRSGYTKIIERVHAARPEVHIEGVHIQRMIPSGQEVIIGAVRDPRFGPMVMFGSGGVEVEGLKDVAFALAPLEQAEAEALIRRTWAGKKLKGFRSIQPADEAAVAEILVRLSHLAHDCPQIQEIEINPLRVLAPGMGTVAVDVRIKT